MKVYNAASGEYIRQIGAGGFKHLFGPRGICLQTHSSTVYLSREDSISSMYPSLSSSSSSSELSASEMENEMDVMDRGGGVSDDPVALLNTMSLLRHKLKRAISNNNAEKIEKYSKLVSIASKHLKSLEIVDIVKLQPKPLDDPLLFVADHG